MRANNRRLTNILTVICPLLLSLLAFAGSSRAEEQAAVPAAGASVEQADVDADADGSDDDAEHRTEVLRGRVVWLAEALERRFGVQSVPEARERILALETIEGRLVPLVENVRGRAFRVDKRLRDMDLELLVRRFEGSPVVQVVRVYEIKAGSKYIVDYWCDVCAIVMFETGACACCQDDNRLRKRLVAE